MTRPTKHLTSLRDIYLMSAGRAQGQRILYMGLARTGPGTRSVWLKAAREAHHEYLRALAQASREVTV